jgi:predicted ATPase
MIEACAHLVETVLRNCREVRILTTSRETLGVAGELAWYVPPLQTPARNAPLSIPELRDYEAVRLFVDRARLAAPRFELSSSNAAAVQQICSRLDGIPLAIELAAIQLKVMSAEDIATRLNDRFRLLRGGSRTALSRQQSLLATIDWSYWLLTEPERKVFRWLSVFVGGWTLEAAEHICQGDTTIAPDPLHGVDVIELLTRLSNKSLLVMSENQGVMRYHFLEVIREYAAEKLENAGESSIVRNRHLDYFLLLGKEKESLLLEDAMPVDQANLLNRLERDLDNVRRAAEWAANTGQIEKGLHLIIAMRWVFIVRAGQNEFVARLQTLLKHSDAAQSTQAEALGHLFVATVQSARSELELSQASLAKAEAIAFTPDDPRLRAWILDLTAFNALDLGDYALTRSCLNQAREIYLSQNVLDWEKHTFGTWEAGAFGSLAMAEGDYAVAKECFGQYHRQISKAGNIMRTTGSARRFGYALLYSGDISEAARRFEESLIGNIALADRLSISACLAACGALALARGAVDSAARLFGASDELRKSLNAPLTPPDARQIQRNVGALRQQLAPAELASSWLAGCAMTLDRAVELALSCCVNEPLGNV